MPPVTWSRHSSPTETPVYSPRHAASIMSRADSPTGTAAGLAGRLAGDVRGPTFQLGQEGVCGLLYGLSCPVGDVAAEAVQRPAGRCVQHRVHMRRQQPAHGLVDQVGEERKTAVLLKAGVARQRPMHRHRIGDLAGAGAREDRIPDAGMDRIGEVLRPDALKHLRAGAGLEHAHAKQGVLRVRDGQCRMVVGRG
jgi:hypothetical protein